MRDTADPTASPGPVKARRTFQEVLSLVARHDHENAVRFACSAMYLLPPQDVYGLTPLGTKGVFYQLLVAQKEWAAVVDGGDRLAELVEAIACGLSERNHTQELPMAFVIGRPARQAVTGAVGRALVELADALHTQGMNVDCTPYYDAVTAVYAGAAGSAGSAP